MLIVSSWAAIPTGDAITMGGTGTIGSIYCTGNDNSAISRNITLTGEGGQFFINGWEGNGWPGSNGNNGAVTPTASTFTGVISGAGNLFVGMGDATTFDGSAANTYTGNTYVTGWANVLTTAQALNGNITIEAGGRVDLAAATSIAANSSVYVGSYQFATPQANQMGVLAVEGDFVPNISSNSSGVLSLLANEPGNAYETGTTGPNINVRLAVGGAAARQRVHVDRRLRRPGRAATGRGLYRRLAAAGHRQRVPVLRQRTYPCREQRLVRQRPGRLWRM